jgi:hypothetical protein
MATTIAQAKQRILNKWDWENPDISYPVILWGPPGLGKSEVIMSIVCERMIEDLKKKYYDTVKQIQDKESEEYKKLTEELERKIKVLNFDYVSHELLEMIAPHCLVLRLAERPIEQLQGVVVPSMSEKENFARFVMPENLVKLKTSPWGIVFLDELDKASDSKFGAATHILENKVIGDLQLGKGWYVIAAANREEDSHLANPIPPELRNRCANIEVESDLNTWINWAVKHNIRKDIILFHKFKNGEWLSNYDLEQTYAFPTPRSWVMASRSIDRLQKKYNPDPTDLKAMEEFNDLVRYELMDFVGKQAQSEFFQYREHYLKFNVLEILDGKKRISTRENCDTETVLISDQCIAAFAMADQVKPDMLGAKGDESNSFKFKTDTTRMQNLTRFIGDLLPEIRTIYLQQIHTTKIMNILVDSGMADDIMEDIIEYIAAA